MLYLFGIIFFPQRWLELRDLLRYGGVSSSIATFWQPFATFTVWDLKGKHIMTVHDMDKARSTYDSFMSALKWAVPVIGIVTLFVVMLIAE